MPDDEKQSPSSSGGGARERAPADEAAGGADSSPLENVPSGQKEQAAEQDMTPGALQPPGRA
jgi:hypothetical protein